MAWAIKDEWIDLARGKHVVIFHNPDVLVVGNAPVEHHLIHEFGVESCPHCGHVKERNKHVMLVEGEEVQVDGVDFHKVKKDTLEALHNHHQSLMEYRQKHPNVRLGSGPKL